MSRPGLSILALAGLLCAAALALAFRPSPSTAAVTAVNAARPTAPAPSSAPPAERPVAATRFSRLPPLHVENQTTREAVDVKLYDAFGNVDDVAATRLDSVLCDGRDPKHPQTTRINRRTLQLMFKAAYHFGLYEIEVVSAYRKPGRHREGFHGTGAAIDFRLRGLSAALLAAYLRDLPRTGVGVYTHPKTQYVHLDSRDTSFHWLDASPPRRRWREKSIGSADLVQRDKAYAPALDLPDGLAGPDSRGSRTVNSVPTPG